MKLKLSHIGLIFLLTLFSCQTENNDAEKAWNEYLKGNRPLLPGNVNVTNMKISNCNDSCLENGKLLSANFQNDTFYLKFSHWFNCAGVGEISANIINDTLEIITQPKPSIIFNGNDTLYDYRSADCYCFYYFETKIFGLKRKPNLIRVDNDFIENYRGPVRNYKE